MKNLNLGNGRTALSYNIEMWGEDISVHIDGGVSHIGSISMVEGNFVKTISFEGHKEEFLTEPLAKALASEFPCRVEVSAGVHLDDITIEEINIILRQNEEALPKVIAALEEMKK